MNDNDTVEILYRNANTQIVKLSCQDYPSIAISVDRISQAFDTLCLIARRCKSAREEEGGDEAEILAELLRHFLRDYEREVGIDQEYPAYEIPIDDRIICYEERDS